MRRCGIGAAVERPPPRRGRRGHLGRTRQGELEAAGDCAGGNRGLWSASPAASRSAAPRLGISASCATRPATRLPGHCAKHVMAELGDAESRGQRFKPACQHSTATSGRGSRTALVEDAAGHHPRWRRVRPGLRRRTGPAASALTENAAELAAGALEARERARTGVASLKRRLQPRSRLLHRNGPRAAAEAGAAGLRAAPDAQGRRALHHARAQTSSRTNPSPARRKRCKRERSACTRRCKPGAASGAARSCGEAAPARSPVWTC